MGDFISRADLASHLQASEVDNATADSAIAAAEALIRRWTGQRISRVTNDAYTVPRFPSIHGRYYRSDRFYVELPERPADQPTLVTIGGTTVTDWAFHVGGMLTRDAGWGEWDDPIVVTYSHGYTTIPEDVKAAAKLLAGRFYANPLERSTERIDDYGYSVGEYTAARELVAWYTRPVFA